MKVASARLHLLAGVVALACATGSGPETSGPMRYRLSGSGIDWAVVGEDRVFEDLQSRYPDFFAVVLDPAVSHDPDVRAIRRDIEHVPVDRRNFDALNAVAIGYFEMTYRGEQARGSGGIGFLTSGFRAAKLAAIPWRAYGLVEDGRLRDGILDFFEDVSRGEKRGSAPSVSRLARVVRSLAKKETDPGRLARIREISERMAPEKQE